jgi:mono/diheme cytochrome c family protein
MRRALIALFAPAALALAAYAQSPPFQADSSRGARLFGELSCSKCHNANGRGGNVAPDLGRLADRGFTPAALAATMWNHAPAMWSAMSAREIRAGDLNPQAAADLFAYFYSTRFFEKPGDAARGKRIFETRGCAGCHGLTQEIRPGVPPVSRWENLNHPIALAEAMWNHMPRMLAATGAKRVSWPELSAQDLADLLVYLRNLPSTRGNTPLFDVTSGENGAALFRSKGCVGCHESDSVLAIRIKGQTVTELAAEMWDHAPKMIAAGAKPPQFQPGEMRELLSYLWARQFFEDSGDPARGKRVFSAKHCADCHQSSAGAAPKIIGSGQTFTGPSMVAALWHHGPAMLQQMQSRGIPWPRLNMDDMSALIAYLNFPNKEKR